ncbi:hypothetical protein GF359_06770 [candidate division WOR-3 bacterium]|uniref:M42 family peptidase n=1 Tax=candidate division WOR-3 bacterium TaxID=2052148 RepID=A0A9D5QDC1_UNCW3|nr:hypothetical protein [candidate division WOR-3 bacterium]MBD3364901.1 hypothetical protein [candidate division WOR-3 bacterium]
MAFGPTGREKSVAAIVAKRAKESGMQVEVDALGNVIALGGPEGPRYVFCAHMDQPGWMVEHMDQKGILHLKPLPAGNKLGQGWGIDENTDIYRISSNDDGKKQEAESLGKGYAGMGTYIVPKPEFEYSSEAVFASALSDRLPAAVLLEAANGIDFSHPVAFCFYTGRYIKAAGLLAALDGLDIERCYTLEVLKSSGDINAGMGTVILLRSRQSIAPHSWERELAGFTENLGVKLQKAVRPENFSAADVLSRSGLPSLVLGIALDYNGTRIEKACISDFDDLKELVKTLSSGGKAG